MAQGAPMGALRLIGTVAVACQTKSAGPDFARQIQGQFERIPRIPKIAFGFFLARQELTQRHDGFLGADLCRLRFLT